MKNDEIKKKVEDEVLSIMVQTGGGWVSKEYRQEALDGFVDLYTEMVEGELKEFYETLDPNACHDPYYLEEKYQQYLLNRKG